MKTVRFVGKNLIDLYPVDGTLWWSEREIKPKGKTATTLYLMEPVERDLNRTLKQNEWREPSGIIHVLAETLLCTVQVDPNGDYVVFAEEQIMVIKKLVFPTNTETHKVRVNGQNLFEGLGFGSSASMVDYLIKKNKDESSPLFKTLASIEVVSPSTNTLFTFKKQNDSKLLELLRSTLPSKLSVYLRQ